jgi:AcrR family transcriptional regulator
MPRKADRELEGRILEAAHQLWVKGGEKALTMRGVAKAAGTTTPTVYERFRDKREIHESLRRRAQMNLYATMQTAAVLEEFPQKYLDFAVKHQHEYELIHADWAVRLGREEPRPSLDLLKDRLAERLGGKPGDHTRLALSIAALAHGIAILLLAEGVHETVARNLREACSAGFEALVNHASRKAGRHKKAWAARLYSPGRMPL